MIFHDFDLDGSPEIEHQLKLYTYGHIGVYPIYFHKVDGKLRISCDCPNGRYYETMLFYYIQGMITLLVNKAVLDNQKKVIHKQFFS